MNKPILLYPVGTDNNGRTTFSGTEFKNLKELKTFQTNAGFLNATVLSNETLYDIKDIEQAIADSK